jgi:hypothetical protein
MLNAGEEGMENSVDWAVLCWSGLFAADSVDSWANKAAVFRSSEKRMVFFMMFNVFSVCLFVRWPDKKYPGKPDYFADSLDIESLTLSETLNIKCGKIY